MKMERLYARLCAGSIAFALLLCSYAPARSHQTTTLYKFTFSITGKSIDAHGRRFAAMHRAGDLPGSAGRSVRTAPSPAKNQP